MRWSVKRRNNRLAGGVFAILVSTVGVTAGSSRAFEFWPAAFGLLILLGMACLELSIHYRLDANEIAVKWLFYTFSFSRGDIEHIERADYTPTVHTFGYGGVGILYGRFHVKPQGNVRIYGGRNPDAGVALSLRDGKTVILTPEDSERFMRELGKLDYPL